MALDMARPLMAAATERLPDSREDREDAAWLFRIVVRLCLDRQPQARWQAAVSAEDAPAPAGNPETRLLVAALRDQLSPPIRAALVLREMEGLEYEEIAQALGVPAGSGSEPWRKTRRFRRCGRACAPSPCRPCLPISTPACWRR